MTAAVAAATAVVQALLAVGWFAALRVPAAVGGRLVVLLTALAADVAVLATDETRPMAHVSPVVALGLLGAVVVQLLRRGGREGLTASLTATVSAAVLAGLGSAWLALDASREGGALVLLAVLVALAAPGADAGAAPLHAPSWAAPAAAAVVALMAAVGVALGSGLDVPVALAAAAGGAVAARLGALLAGRVVAPDPLLTWSLPPLLVAPVVYVLARLLVG